MGQTQIGGSLLTSVTCKHYRTQGASPAVSHLHGLADPSTGQLSSGKGPDFKHSSGKGAWPALAQNKTARDSHILILHLPQTGPWAQNLRDTCCVASLLSHNGISHPGTMAASRKEPQWGRGAKVTCGRHSEAPASCSSTPYAMGGSTNLLLKCG